MNASGNVLNRFFSQNTLRQFVTKSDDTLGMMHRIICKYDIKTNDCSTNEHVISRIYKYMKESYRNEYFYKNTLLNKLLINVHRINTTTALTEVAIAKSKADFIMINGKAVVYEIKTDLDSFDRLLTQISDYYKAFDHVCVVTSELRVKSLEKVLKNSPFENYVGIYVLKRNDRIGRLKEPKQYQERLETDSMFKILNKPEYEAIIKKVYGDLPKVVPVKYYRACKDILCNISVDKFYQLFLVELKKRRRQKKLNSTSSALSFLLYFSKDCGNKQGRIDDFLSMPFERR